MEQAPGIGTTRYDSSALAVPYEALSSPERPARIRYCAPHQSILPQRALHQQPLSLTPEVSDITDLQQPPSPESDVSDTPTLSDLARLRLAELKLKKLIPKHERYLDYRDYEEPELHRAKKAEADGMLTRAGRHAGTNYRRTEWDHGWDNMVTEAARVLVGEPFERLKEETDRERRNLCAPGVFRMRKSVREKKRKVSVFDIRE